MHKYLFGIGNKNNTLLVQKKPKTLYIMYYSK